MKEQGSQLHCHLVLFGKFCGTRNDSTNCLGNRDRISFLVSFVNVRGTVTSHGFDEFTTDAFSRVCKGRVCLSSHPMSYVVVGIFTTAKCGHLCGQFGRMILPKDTSLYRV